MSKDVYRRRRVVAAEDVDSLGHVNNTVWVRFIVELADAHSSARGLDWRTVRALVGQWIVRRHEIDYLRSALRGEEIVEETPKLIRKLLEYAERQTSGGFYEAPECSEYAWEVVHYHIGLCGQAGYFAVQQISGAEEPHVRYALGSLTWLGHEALDKLREG